MSASHAERDQPTVRSTSAPSFTRIRVGTVSMSWWYETARSVVVDGVEALGEGRVVLGEDGERDAGLAQLAQDRGDEHASRALAP